MRVFLGIDLPEETKKELFNQLLPLRLKHRDYRWVEPKNYHLTVHFFGQVISEKPIADRLRDILYDAPVFYLYALKLEVFANKQVVLYVSFKRQKQLEQIVTTVRTDLGEETKLEFVPHVTVSRSALSSKQQYFALEREINKLNINLEFKVEKLYLYETIMLGKVATYHKREEFPLLSP